MVTSLWPTLLATWLSLAPPPPAGTGPGAGQPVPAAPPPGIALSRRRD
jgi:hypothetical protein